MQLLLTLVLDMQNKVGYYWILLDIVGYFLIL